jgi:GT2 family glycosyltransferase
VAPSGSVCKDDSVAEVGPYAVVVVTHNHAETVGACLKAVEGLAPSPARVVVVDNASADGSFEIARRSCGDLDSKLIAEKRNTGFAAANNRGIAATSEPWVLLLNPDCAPEPDLISVLLEAVASRPEAERIGAVSPKLVRADGSDLGPTTVIDAAGMVVTCSGRHFDRGAGDVDDGGYDEPAWVFGGTAAALLLRREALDDVAYPDNEFFAEFFFAYREDAELAWRLQLRDWLCLYAPSAVAAHRRGFRPEQGRRGHRAINRHSVRNRFLLRRHCADAAWYLHCFPAWLIRDLMVVAACLTVEWSSLPGLVDVVRLRGDSRRHREWVQGRRTAPSRRINRWFRRRRVEEVEGP